jgi:hypothetical protein
MTTTTAGVRIGQVLHGTCRIVRHMAGGGMGIVHEAEHLRLATDPTREPGAGRSGAHDAGAGG